MRLKAWFVAASLLGSPGAAIGQETPAEDGFRVDEQGRRFRTDFSVSERIYVGGHTNLDGQMHAELGIQTSWDLDFPQEEVWWQIRHTWLSTVVGSSTHFTALEGHYLRHDTSSFVLIPGEVDLRLPAPFDIALDWQVADLVVETGKWDVSAIEVARLHIGADLVRDEDFRHRLVVAVVPFFVMRFDENPNQLSPFTVGSLRWGYHTDDGRFAAQILAEGGYETRMGESREWALVARIGFEVEWIFVAVNDQPISLVLASEHTLNETWKATAGLRISFFGD